MPMENNPVEITPHIVNEVISNLPKDADSGEFLSIATDLLNRYSHAFISGSTIRSLIKDPDGDVEGILSHVQNITKEGDTISVSVSEPVEYKLRRGAITLQPENSLVIDHLTKTLIVLSVSGVRTSFGALEKIRIEADAIKVQLNPGKFLPSFYKTIWKP